MPGVLFLRLADRGSGIGGKGTDIRNGALLTAQGKRQVNGGLPTRREKEVDPPTGGGDIPGKAFRDNANGNSQVLLTQKSCAVDQGEGRSFPLGGL